MAQLQYDGRVALTTIKKMLEGAQKDQLKKMLKKVGETELTLLNKDKEEV